MQSIFVCENCGFSTVEKASASWSAFGLSLAKATDATSARSKAHSHPPTQQQQNGIRILLAPEAVSTAASMVLCRMSF
jgi:hypothetical protein